jgi:hypothetical protein
MMRMLLLLLMMMIHTKPTESYRPVYKEVDRQGFRFVQRRHLYFMAQRRLTETFG